MEPTKVPKIIPTAAEPTLKRIVPEIAYFVKESNGGFQLYKIFLKDNPSIKLEKVEDPDAWDQVINVLENELSRQFQ